MPDKINGRQPFQPPVSREPGVRPGALDRPAPTPLAGQPPPEQCHAEQPNAKRRLPLSFAPAGQTSHARFHSDDVKTESQKSLRIPSSIGAVGTNPQQRREQRERAIVSAALRGNTPRVLAPGQESTRVSSRTRFYEDGSSKTTHHEVVAPTLGGKSKRKREEAIVSADLRGNRETVGPNGERAGNDAHKHHRNYYQRGPALKKLLAMMSQLNLGTTVLMPLPTSYQRKNGLSAPEREQNARAAELAATAGCEVVNPDTGRYYVPDKHSEKDFQNTTNEEFDAIVATGDMDYETAVDAHLAATIDRAGLSEAERAMFDPMVTGLHLGHEKNATDLLRKLADHKGVFTGIGEVTIHKELVEGMLRTGAQANLTNNVKHFKNLLEVAGVVGMPVTLHCDVDKFQNNQALRSDSAAVRARHRPEYLDQLAALFGSLAMSKTQLIWAHAGGLGRFIEHPANHTTALAALLEANPTLHIDLSWDRAATQVTKPEHLEAWTQLIEAYPDRFLMGSDTVAPAAIENWAATFEIYEPLLQALQPSTRELLLNGNYDRVIKGAREKVREFEDKVLTPDFIENALTATNAPEITARLLRDRLAEIDAAAAAAG